MLDFLNYVFNNDIKTIRYQKNPKTNNSEIVTLLKLILPRFNGNIQKWLSFRNLFRSSIYNDSKLSDSQKLTYLKLFLHGETALTVQPIIISAADYKIEWELLGERYSNVKIQVCTHLKFYMSLFTTCLNFKHVEHHV